MSPDTWLEELSHELTVRGLPTIDVAGIVVELHGHLAEAGGTPMGTFGPPAAYADRLAASLRPSPAAAAPSPDRSRRGGRLRIRAEGVAMAYRRRRVLHGVDLVVRAGELVLLTGRNGAGKSTLLRIVAGLAVPQRGRVTVHGSVGYAPQSGGLVEHLRPAEHFLLFGRSRGLDGARAHRHGARLAEQLGWDALGAPVVGELSGGTRQKLNVVLAGLGDPDVLLLDEPYQGLDLDSTRRFWELVWAWRDAGRAVLVVSHSRDALGRVDQVVELRAPVAA